MKSYKAIDEYINSYPIDTQNILKKIRSILKNIIPEAVETISYGIPTFDINNKHVVHFGGFKTHVSIFPTSSPIPVFKKELKPYKTSKGAIQFSLDKDIPYELIERIVKYRIKELKK